MRRPPLTLKDVADAILEGRLRQGGSRTTSRDADASGGPVLPHLRRLEEWRSCLPDPRRDVQEGDLLPDVRGHRRLFHRSNLSSRIPGDNAAAYLRARLQEGFPVIVGVGSPGTIARPGSKRLNADGVPGHFVLVVGESGGTFLIQDPAATGATTLEFYGNDYVTRGYVSDPPFPVLGQAMVCRDRSQSSHRFLQRL